MSKTFFAEAGGGIRITDREMVYRVRVITAGQGSSAYWPLNVLQEQLEGALPLGSHSHMNHPTDREEWEYPSRRADTIIGKKVSPLEYVAAEASFYAEYEFDRKLKDTLEQFGDVLAMSVYIYTESEPGDAHGVPTPYITKLVPHPVNSCDMVANAGANGAIVGKVSESLSMQGFELRSEAIASPQSTTKKESTVDENKLKELLAEANANLVSALSEALAPAPASESATPSQIAEVVAESGLSKEGRGRVYSRIDAGEAPEAAVASEKAYAEALRAEILAEAGNQSPKRETLGLPIIDSAPAAAGDSVKREELRERFEKARKAVGGKN